MVVIIIESFCLRFSKLIPFIIFLGTLFCAEVSRSDVKDSSFVNDKSIPSSYLDSRKELEDYIIGKGDGLYNRILSGSRIKWYFPC